MGEGGEAFGEWAERFPIPSGDDFKSSASLAAKEERSGAETLSPGRVTGEPTKEEATLAQGTSGGTIDQFELKAKAAADRTTWQRICPLWHRPREWMRSWARRLTRARRRGSKSHVEDTPTQRGPVRTLPDYVALAVTTVAALSDASKKHIALCFLGSSLINSHGNLNHPSVPSARAI